MKKSMSLHDAAHLAAFCYSRLERHARRLVVCGSVRRGAPICNDIEIVMEPSMNIDLFGGETPVLDPIIDTLVRIGTIKKQGARYIQVVDIFEEEGISLDLFLCHPPAQWGSIVAIRTGPWQLSKFAVEKMKVNGLRHINGHVEDASNGNLIPTPTEKHFFDCADLPFVDPEERKALAKQLGAMA